MSYLSTPHQAFTAGFYTDPDFDYTVRSLLGFAPAGGSEPGEVLAAIAPIADGAVDAWFAGWHSLGLRLFTLGEELQEAGRFDGASGAYLRAANYLAVAVNSAEKDTLIPTFRQYAAAWDGFIDTTVYAAERVDIPYEGSTLPGYLVSPADDGEARATVILNNGSEGSHAALWGSTAHAALARGYAVLFFDGPGQQSMLFERAVTLRHDWEHVVTPVVDFLLGRTDVDGDRLAIYGTGQGGYLVPRALAFEKRIAAAIIDPAVTDVASFWMSQLPQSLTRSYAEGNREAFDRDMALGMKYSASTARSWTRRARPYQQPGYFATLQEVSRYTLRDVAAHVTTPCFVAAAEDEQFWPGQSAEFAAQAGGPTHLQEFTTEEGANLHCQPLARTLATQRMFDWLDATLEP
jgi:alpha-beta hydrolase superfamily lysophospholipase